MGSQTSERIYHVLALFRFARTSPRTGPLGVWSSLSQGIRKTLGTNNDYLGAGAPAHAPLSLIGPCDLLYRAPMSVHIVSERTPKAG
jgi:hypothetical protein